MSGNGCQLWFAVPPTMFTDEQRPRLRDRLKHFEARLRDKFAGDGVAIDSIYNFSRIIKVIGTLSVKGEDTDERPHRVSHSLDAFERREDFNLLEAIFRIPLPASSPSPIAEGSEMTVRAADQLSPKQQPSGEQPSEEQPPEERPPEEQAPEEQAPEGWPPYYPPRLVRDLAGTDAVTGDAAAIERGYVLHRIDLEKVRVLDARAARCDQDLGVCEQRVASMAVPSGFWDGSVGRVFLIGLGFLAGMGATAAIAIVVE